MNKYTKHTREVEKYIDFLAEIGGVFDIFMVTLTFICGGYLRFRARFVWIQQLF